MPRYHSGMCPLPQIFITLLTVYAAVVAAIASVSALRSWRETTEANAKATVESEISKRLSAQQDSEIEEIQNSDVEDKTARVLAVGLAHTARRAELGLPTPTYSDLEAGGVPPLKQASQTPSEVWWGLSALAAATAAGIWGTWI